MVWTLSALVRSRLVSNTTQQQEGRQSDVSVGCATRSPAKPCNIHPTAGNSTSKRGVVPVKFRDFGVALAKGDGVTAIVPAFVVVFKLVPMVIVLCLKLQGQCICSQVWLVVADLTHGEDYLSRKPGDAVGDCHPWGKPCSVHEAQNTGG